MTIEKIYYVTEAFVTGYDQGTELLLIKSNSGEILGLSSEFEIYTRDIEIVSGSYDPNRAYAQAQWTDFDTSIGTTPASWSDIIGTNIEDFIIGYRLESELQIHRFKNTSDNTP